MVYRRLSNPTNGPSTRSQSRGRTKGQDPQMAVSCSLHDKVKPRASQSQARNTSLPPNDNNNKPTPTVSHSSLPSINSAQQFYSEPPDNTSSSELITDTVIQATVDMNKNKDSSVPTSTLGAEDEVSDNGGEEEHEEILGSTSYENNSKEIPKPSPPPEAWQETLQQLKAIGQQVSKLDKIEKTTDKLSQQMESLAHRTTSLEDFAQKASTRFSNIESQITEINESSIKTNDLEERLQRLKTDIQQENDERIIHLQQEINIHKTHIKALKKHSETLQEGADSKQVLIGAFKKQAESLKKENDDQKIQLKNLQTKVSGLKRQADSSVEELRQELHYQSLKDHAFQNRYNLVISGLPEQSNISAYSQAIQFLTTQFKAHKNDVHSAYRMGTIQQEGGSYIRPLVIVFKRLPDRNNIWKRRMEIQQTQGAREIYIQADIPRKLRADLQVLYRVAKAASSIPKYNSALVKDYKLHLNGQEFSAHELETLPFPLRPSTLATPRSENTLVFFSRHSILSNHYPAEFDIQGTKYHSMEHFLAVKRARLSGIKTTIDKALATKDPTEAKVILNSLQDDHKDEWKHMIADLAMEGLRAKFTSNRELANYLCDTEPLLLGEASRDKTWGIGLSLEDEGVLDQSKWYENGNLLGRSLMKIRRELLTERIN